MMRERLRRLLHGQTCPVCKRRRRIIWYSDTGCCTRNCLLGGLMFPASLRPSRVQPTIDRLQEAIDKSRGEQ